MTRVKLTLKDERRLDIRCDASALQEERGLSDEDFKQFGTWSGSYRAATNGQKAKPDVLLRIGREMCGWLDGSQRFVERLLKSATAPVVFEFVTDRGPSEEGRALLDAPWELVADERGHWAGIDAMMFCPVRRLGIEAAEAEVSPYTLSVVFMAAAPREMDTLRFEAEEAAILGATKGVGLDLVVEESGTLGLLKDCVVRQSPVDVVHLACHGKVDGEPKLWLEDEYGDGRPATGRQVIDALSGHWPRLVFLSACETGRAEELIESLACSLVESGAPAVLGWAASVSDQEATRFAGLLYRRLAEGEPLTEAVARARWGLMTPEGGGVGSVGGRSTDWHLARLFVGRAGGGVPASGRQGRRRRKTCESESSQTDVYRQSEAQPSDYPYRSFGRTKLSSQHRRTHGSNPRQRCYCLLSYGSCIIVTGGKSYRFRYGYLLYVVREGHC